MEGLGDIMDFYITKIDIDHIDATTYGARQLQLVQGFMTVNYFAVRGVVKIDCAMRISTDMNLTIQ